MVFMDTRCPPNNLGKFSECFMHKKTLTFEFARIAISWSEIELSKNFNIFLLRAAVLFKDKLIEISVK
jgi:hypothetical protein